MRKPHRNTAAAGGTDGAVNILTFAAPQRLIHVSNPDGDLSTVLVASTVWRQHRTKIFCRRRKRHVAILRLGLGEIKVRTWRECY